jgi:hypothetical protein
MKKIIATLAFLISSTAFATEIKFYIPFKAGGGGAHFGQLIKDGLEKNSYKVDFKSINNCALVKDTFVNSKDPMVTIWLTDFNRDATTPCFLPLERRDFVNILYYSPKFLCVRDSKLDSKKSYRVAINKEDDARVVSEELSRTLKTKIQAIAYTNSGEVKTAYLNKEVDGVFNSHGRQLEKEGHSTCLASNYHESINGVPSLSALDSKNILKNHQVIMYVLARNFDDASRAKLVAQVQAIIDSDEYQKQINARMLLSTTKNVSSQLQAISEQYPK